MMLGNELSNSFYDVGRHRDSFDKIAASVSERLTFRRISRYGENPIWPLGRNRTQGDPQSGRARRKIFPIICCLRPMQFDHRFAGKKQGRFCFGIERRPGRG